MEPVNKYDRLVRLSELSEPEFVRKYALQAYTFLDNKIGLESSFPSEYYAQRVYVLDAVEHGFFPVQVYQKSRGQARAKAQSQPQRPPPHRNEPARPSRRGK